MLAEEPVVSLNLKNNTEETVFWLLAFEETDAMDGTLKEKLGNWIPSRVFELDGPEMAIVFTSVVADEGKTTFNFEVRDSDEQLVDEYTLRITTNTPSGPVALNRNEEISEDLRYLHFDLVGENRRWMVKRVSEISEFEDVSVSRSAIGFYATNRWKSRGLFVNVD